MMIITHLPLFYAEAVHLHILPRCDNQWNRIISANMEIHVIQFLLTKHPLWKLNFYCSHTKKTNFIALLFFYFYTFSGVSVMYFAMEGSEDFRRRQQQQGSLKVPMKSKIEVLISLLNIPEFIINRLSVWVFFFFFYSCPLMSSNGDPLLMTSG